MDAILPIIAFSVVVGAVIAFVIFGTYFRKRKSEIQSITRPETLNPNPKPPSKPSAAKKPHHKSHSHSHAADKVKIEFFCLFLGLTVLFVLGFKLI